MARASRPSAGGVDAAIPPALARAINDYVATLERWPKCEGCQQQIGTVTPTAAGLTLVRHDLYLPPGSRDGRLQRTSFPNCTGWHTTYRTGNAPIVEEVLR